ncbi:MAG: SulP family inorganic anion transporter, partial [Belliella pelovolcani]
LNKIPLAALAAILLLIGYKLARFSLFKNQLRLGWDQFLPFLVTVVSILIFDLLIGISLGVMIAIFFILLRNFQNSHLLVKESIDQKDVIKVKLSEEMSFLNKGALIKTLENIPENGHVIIDGSKSKIIDYDVLEVIENFKISAIDKGIKVETIKIKSVNPGAIH